jgi:hypothetical protein
MIWKQYNCCWYVLIKLITQVDLQFSLRTNLFRLLFDYNLCKMVREVTQISFGLLCFVTVFIFLVHFTE